MTIVGGASRRAPQRVYAKEDASVVLMARQTMPESRTVILQDDVDFTVLYLYYGDTLTQQFVLEPADVWYPSPQVDADWPGSSEGYVFRHTVSGVYMPKGGATYLAEYVNSVFQNDNIHTVRLSWEIVTQPGRT